MSRQEEISTLIETEAAHVYDKKNSFNLKLASLALTFMGLLVGGVVWATTCHADIKDWTAEQDFVTKTELQDVMKEQYVKREDFAIVKQKLENLNENHQRLMKLLDKIDNKLDILERGVSRRNR
jgi:uncharacterized membrane protein YgaE (UPF0421/DUF939 family)